MPENNSNDKDIDSMAAAELKGLMDLASHAVEVISTCRWCRRTGSSDDMIARDAIQPDLMFCDNSCRASFIAYDKLDFVAELHKALKVGTSEARTVEHIRDLLTSFDEEVDRTLSGRTFINLTPHLVRMNDGREFPPSGKVVRLATNWSEPENDIAEFAFGNIENLPDYKGGSPNIYIVSLPVLQALEGWRDDIVAPATGHPKAVRDSNGQIVSVPCFCRQTSDNVIT